ncbi:hypothetical protein NX059_003447 [Plenodomus lindquistii]|nr:hypothetical protein NX059_003447 [Plenodomus lindquistii]
MPEVCSHYLRGTCKFGPRCFKQHPAGQEGSESNSNRFGGFSGGDRYRPAPNNALSNPLTGNRDQNSTASFNLSEADIKKDIEERPLYPISCYGPGRGAPRQLIEGPVEISPEELRLRYYTLRAIGDEGTAKQEEAALGTKMEQQLKAILDDIPGAIKYIEDGANVHPNRIDITNGTAASNGTASAFGGASGVAANLFGKPAAPTNPFSAGSTAQPSAFGQVSKPGFGQPAFGQPSNPAQTTSAFGQPSNPGQNASPFGQPSNPGQNVSPFGAASTLGQKPSPFGQPSALGGGGAFGKPAFGASGFGQPSMPGAGNAFGQTGNVGQASAFGQSGATSGFGQANALGQTSSPFAKPGFGQSGFGQVAQPGASASPFGQAGQSGEASPFGQQPQSTQSVFGQPAAVNQSPFGQPTQTTPSPFGQPAQPGTQASPFGQATPQTQSAANPFQQGQTEAPGDKASPFASAASQPSIFGQPSKQNTNPFGAPAAQNDAVKPANPFLSSQTSAPAAASSTPGFGFHNQTAAPTAQSTSQKAGTAFKPQGGAPTNGNIDPKERFKEGKPEEYEGEQGEILEEIYKRVAQLGRFDENEDIPLTPPKCEWIVPMPV